MVAASISADVMTPICDSCQFDPSHICAAKTGEPRGPLHTQWRCTYHWSLAFYSLRESTELATYLELLVSGFDD